MTFITPQRFETSQPGDGSPSKRGTFGTKPRSACLPNFYGVQLFLTSIIFATASVSFKMAMACHGYGWLGSLGAIARLLPRTQASLAMSAGPRGWIGVPNDAAMETSGSLDFQQENSLWPDFPTILDTVDCTCHFVFGHDCSMISLIGDEHRQVGLDPTWIEQFRHPAIRKSSKNR
jgi:hypothetical protein